MSQLNVGKVNVTGDGVQYPQYTNSNRPAGTTGLVIYNTSESKLQVYTGSEWESVGAGDEEKVLALAVCRSLVVTDRSVHLLIPLEP